MTIIKNSSFVSVPVHPNHPKSLIIESDTKKRRAVYKHSPPFDIVGKFPYNQSQRFPLMNI